MDEGQQGRWAKNRSMLAGEQLSGIGSGRDGRSAQKQGWRKGRMAGQDRGRTAWQVRLQQGSAQEDA